LKFCGVEKRCAFVVHVALWLYLQFRKRATRNENINGIKKTVYANLIVNVYMFVSFPDKNVIFFISYFNAALR
jgi:hypothetical protein